LKRRNNEDRLVGGHKPTPAEDAPPMGNPMDFVTPSEFVMLPSRGRYPEGHALHGQDSIEIKYMTAKDEDILTNRSLLKKGLAIDRLIQNLVKDKSVNSRSLLVGDRNAIIVHARASAYGAEYKTTIQCPVCAATSKWKFDLNDYEEHLGNEFGETSIVDNEDMTFTVTLPLSKLVAVIRPLVGQDEIDMLANTSAKNATSDLVSGQMKKYVVSFNGYDDAKTINHVCENMVAGDAKYIRQAHALISPDIKMQQKFVCKECDHEEVMNVPFGTDFFWPE